jgi:hypothetical protein
MTRRRLRFTRTPGIGRRSGAVRVSGNRYATVIARDERPLISLDFTPPASEATMRSPSEDPP